MDANRRIALLPSGALLIALVVVAMLIRRNLQQRQQSARRASSEGCLPTIGVARRLWGHAAARGGAREERPRAVAGSHEVQLSATAEVASSHPRDTEMDPWQCYAISEREVAELWQMLRQLDQRGEVRWA